MSRFNIKLVAFAVICLVCPRCFLVIAPIMGKEYWGLNELSKEEQAFFHLSKQEQVVAFSKMPVEQQVDVLVKYFPRSHHGNYGLCEELAKREEKALPVITDALQNTKSIKHGSDRARVGLVTTLHFMLHVNKFDFRSDPALMNALNRISAEKGVDPYVKEDIEELIKAPSPE